MFYKSKTLCEFSSGEESTDETSTKTIKVKKFAVSVVKEEVCIYCTTILSHKGGDIDSLMQHCLTCERMPGKSLNGGSTRFHCYRCRHTTTYRCALKKHIRRHLGDNPFKCTMCAASFTKSERLHMHLKTHLGEKPHKCEQCEFSTSRRSSLYRHVRTQHSPGDDSD